jgi:fluoroacetyl-CoA thioesterase
VEGEYTLDVSEGTTAHSVGNVGVRAFSTPHLVGLVEAAALMAVQSRLAPGEAMVGVHVDVHHVAPAYPGDRVTARARLVHQSGRRFGFAFEARRGDGTLVGYGTYVASRVELRRFLGDTSRT